MAPPGGAESEVGDLANLVVTEVVRVGPSLADDTAAPEFVQAANQRMLTGVTRVGQYIRRELSPDGRGQADQVPGRLGQLRQAVLDNGLDFRTHVFPLAVRAPAGAQRFDHEEWITFGLVEQLVCGYLPYRVVRKLVREHHRFLKGETVDFDLR